MQYTTHSQTGASEKLPLGDETPIFSYSPVVIPVAERAVDLQLKVSFPAKGDALPIILLSHGHGPSAWIPSLHGYGPLNNFYAGHGFAVLQPTHLNTRTVAIEHPKGSEMGWDSRHTDMVKILDELDLIEDTVPGLKGRLDRSRIAVVSHSFGGLVANMLLGASNTDPRTGTKTHINETRVKAGVFLGSPGTAAGLSDKGKVVLPFYNPDFTTVTKPSLVVCGENDGSPYTTRGPQWHAEPYTEAPGPRDLLWIKGGKHGFGGVAGWDAAETDDGSPERLAFVQRMTLAYLKSQLYEGDKSWEEACEALKGLQELGSVESKV